jgi:1-acyl-sn-glycerol-3-phosphate acyltransferase
MPIKFDSIRPYDDSDLPSVLPKLFNNKEFVDALVTFKFSAWPGVCRPFLNLVTRRYIRNKIANVHTLVGFQRLVEPYMTRMVNKTTDSFSVTGLDSLDSSVPYLFVSNHRDIALDPAFINWALHLSGQETVRIAVGDNLLKNEWVADLIRLNKCFIVKRSETDRRKKFAAAKLLSEYIEFTLKNDRQHIWIAQREGRAKDGNDITNPAIISMLALNKPKTTDFSAYIQSLRIVPVSISYEFDPCDISKAKELHQFELEGCYDKPDNEDMRSIVNGITGQKGNVHLHFGAVVSDEFENARQVADYIDDAILSGYRSFTTGVTAAKMLNLKNGKFELSTETEVSLQAAQRYLQTRLEKLSEPEQIKLLTMYANAFLKQST